MIRRHGLSMAIFAQGWTHESIVRKEDDSIGLMEYFFNKDSAFWNSLWPYLYTHPITNYFSTSFYKGADTVCELIFKIRIFQKQNQSFVAL